VSGFRRALSVLLSTLIVTNAVGCTKRVGVPREQYGEVLGGEDFIHVTTTNGEVFELQEAKITDVGISGLLRHDKGDVKPVGLGGKEDRSAFIEIRMEDVLSIEVERINKKGVLLAFGLVGAGLLTAIALVQATGESDGGGSSGGEPGGKDPF